MESFNSQLDSQRRGSAAVLENINNILESPKVGETLSEAVSETTEIGEKILETFNEKPQYTWTKRRDENSIR